MDNENPLNEFFDRVVDRVREQASKMTPEQIEELSAENAEAMDKHLNTPLEDWSTAGKIASAMHLRYLYPALNPTQMWLIDFFVVATGLFLLDDNEEKYDKRMMGLVEYIKTYKHWFSPDR
jgi:hypothetical protein